MYLHCRNLQDQILSLLSEEENESFEGWKEFLDSSHYTRLGGRVLNNLNQIQVKMKGTKKYCKLFFRSMKISKRKETAAIMAMIKDEEEDVWPVLEQIVTAFISGLLNRKMKTSKGNDKLELVRLDAILNLCIIFNQMGIFEPDYCGDNYVTEIKQVLKLDQLSDLELLCAKFHQLAIA